MSTSIAIARREFKTFFNSPIAYIVLMTLLIIWGILFFTPFFVQQQATLRGFFALGPILLVLFLPAVTMRLLAEERKSGTFELLLTMPLEDWEIVVGKFLAALATVAVGLACTLVYAISVSAVTMKNASFDWGPVFAGYVGLLLLASALIALGLWASAMSRNQIIGFIVALLIGLVLLFIDKFAIFLPEALSEAVQYVSVDHHFANIARGVIAPGDVFFYLSLTAAGLLFSTRTVAAARK